MSQSLRQWAGQITTGFAAAGGFATVSAALLHQMTWQQAVIPLTGAVVLALWPENKTLAQDAETLVQAVEPVVNAVMAKHAVTTVAPVVVLKKEVSE